MGRRRPTKPEAPELAQTLHGAVVEATLDLHGRNAAQALRRVETFLDLWARQSPGAVLRIITGKGNRSAGAPVLRSKVGDLLRAEVGGRISEMVLDAGGGGWLIRIRVP